MFYQRGLPGMRKRYPHDHMVMTGYLNNLGQSLYLGKKFAEAEQIMTECVPLLDKNLGEGRNRWKVFRGQVWLGDSLREQEKYDEAEIELIASYEGLVAQKEKTTSNYQPYLVLSVESLIKLYQSRGREGDEENVLKWKTILESAKSELQAVEN